MLSLNHINEKTLLVLKMCEYACCKFLTYAHMEIKYRGLDY